MAIGERNTRKIITQFKSFLVFSTRFFAKRKRPKKLNNKNRNSEVLIIPEVEEKFGSHSKGEIAPIKLEKKGIIIKGKES